MKKEVKPTEVKTQSKVLTEEQRKEKGVILLKEYQSLTVKKTHKEARQLRRKLRRLGIYVSKLEKKVTKKDKVSDKVEDKKVLPKVKKIAKAKKVSIKVGDIIDTTSIGKK